MDKILLSVVTVTYNNEEIIDVYINSLLKNLPHQSEVIILDNNSTDKTPQILRARKDIKLIESKQNLGFSKGNNLAVKSAKGEYLFFLNPDTEVLDDAIRRLLSFMSEHSDAGIVAPKLIERTGKVQPSVRKPPSLIGALKEYFLGIKNSYEAYVPKGENPQIVECVVGGAILLKRNIFEKVGGFDERYFMYFEDLELCKRIRQLGYKIYYLPEAKIIHEVGGSVSPLKKQWIVESAEIYHGKMTNFLLFILLRTRNIKGKLFRNS